MKHAEIKTMMAEIAPVIREFTAAAMEPVLTRLAAVESRFDALPVPKDGEDADPQAVAGIVIEQMSSDLTELRRSIQELPIATDVSRMIAEAAALIPKTDVEPMIAEKVAAAVAALPVPADGKDGLPGEAGRDGADGTSVDPVAVEAMVTYQLAAAVANLPAPADGKDAEIDIELLTDMITASVTACVNAQPPALNGKDGLPGEPGPAGADGKDIDPEVVKAAIVEQVEATLAGWERPQDGKSVTTEELLPLIEESAQRVVSTIPVPKDGKDGRDGADTVDLLIDRDGALVATLSNGKTKTLGPVVGKDGTDGADGKDGAPGKDGEPGLGFDDMTEEIEDDGRTLVRRYVRGDQVKEVRHKFAVVLDRGVFKEGSTYVAGDGVTWAGSFWIAQDETTEKPDTGKGWRLAVKRGRDGKDGRMMPPTKKEPVKI